MEANEKDSKGFFQKFLSLAEWMDEKLRFGDFNSNRTVGGKLDRTFGISRHSYHYALLPSLVAAIIVMGVPELGLRFFASTAVFIITFCVIILFARFSEKKGYSLRTELLFQLIIVLITAGGVWVGGGSIYSHGFLIYKHFFVIMAAVVGVSLFAGVLVSGWVWHKWSITNNYKQALRKTELFMSHDPEIPLNWKRFLFSLFTFIQGAPLQLFLLPSIVAIMASKQYLEILSITFFLLSFLLLLMAGFNARLNHIWILFQSAFFRGGARLVSFAVIIIAIARLCEVSYVSTVLDTAERLIIALLLFSSYVLLWWYDYWTNRLLGQELLKMISGQSTCDAQIPYLINPEAQSTRVLPEGRILQIHGASRFVVIGSSKKDDKPRFQTYSFEELFKTLAISGFPGGKASPSPRQLAARIFDYKCITASILFGLAVLLGSQINHGIQHPQLVVDNNGSATLTLSKLLTSHTAENPQESALIVAASGGGTRAALYTAAVLEGLASTKQIDNVILGSGVSGGGASLAYFAGKRRELLESEGENWNHFFKTMSEPFIQDVIKGAFEWRIVSSYRLGILLKESFERRWKLEKHSLGDVENFGLILNTSIAGHFECDSKSEDCLRKDLNEAEKKYRKDMTHSNLAGGRLLLTNLQLEKDFVPSVTEVGGPEGIPIIVNDVATTLEVAAALNANFPPVFPNAAIDINNESSPVRYWVTDGGTVDNRGIEMALFALKKTLSDINRFPDGQNLPKVTIVAADASAFSDKYVQDRGVGTMMGASTQFASLLMEELLHSIRLMYLNRQQDLNDFKFIYLPMPLCLRESGSFGTHWMLQPYIKVSLGLDKGNRKISGSEMIEVLRKMHAPQDEQTRKLSKAAQEVLEYSLKDAKWAKGAEDMNLK